MNRLAIKRYGAGGGFTPRCSSSSHLYLPQSIILLDTLVQGKKKERREGDRAAVCSENNLRINSTLSRFHLVLFFQLCVWMGECEEMFILTSK